MTTTVETIKKDINKFNELKKPHQKAASEFRKAQEKLTQLEKSLFDEPSKYQREKIHTQIDEQKEVVSYYEKERSYFHGETDYEEVLSLSTKIDRDYKNVLINKIETDKKVLEAETDLNKSIAKLLDEFENVMTKRQEVADELEKELSYPEVLSQLRGYVITHDGQSPQDHVENYKKVKVKPDADKDAKRIVSPAEKIKGTFSFGSRAIDVKITDDKDWEEINSYRQLADSSPKKNKEKKQSFIQRIFSIGANN